MTHKTWAPFAIIGILVLVVISVFVFRGSESEGMEMDDQVSEIADARKPITVEDYKFEMQNAIDAFRANLDGESFKSDLLTIRVPKEYLDLHLAFVGAVDSNDSTESAIAEINQLTQTASWLD